MPRPVPDPIRTVIWRRCQRGQTAAQIAEELSLSPRTVRHLVQRFRRHGEPAIPPGYHRKAADADTDDEGVLATALA